LSHACSVPRVLQLSREILPRCPTTPS
jgi:hypothetical protein